jgi:hypothetical protein
MTNKQSRTAQNLAWLPANEDEHSVTRSNRNAGKSVTRSQGWLEKQAAIAMGELRPQIICQMCGERGHVRTKQVKRKTGIHGGKATAAVLTGGWSMLATGLSGKQMVTEAYCDACESRYQF